MKTRLLLASVCALAALAIPPSSMAAKPLTLSDYVFVCPEGWVAQETAEQILLSQVPDQTGCIIQVLPPQPSSGDLERDARAVFDLMYPGWNYQKSGEARYTVSRGTLSQGFAFCLFEAPMSATSQDGRYHLEEGVALVVKLGAQVAIVAARHRGLAAHADCHRKYNVWRRFFNSFTVKSVTPSAPPQPNPKQRIVGVWSQSESGAASELIFSANGHFARTGALGTSSTSRDFNFEYLHVKTYAFQGDGAYTLAGNKLTLQRSDTKAAEEARFRFEEVNHGGAGWRDRVWLLTKDRFGENEVVYERRTKR